MRKFFIYAIISIFMPVIFLGKALSLEAIIAGEKFNLEVAKTKKELRKGLMFRKSINIQGGMLFVYPPGRKPRIWMKNTLVSLDILFLDKNKKIVCLYENAVPLDTSNIIQCKKSSSYVIELKAKTIERLKLKPGDRVKFKL